MTFVLIAAFNPSAGAAWTNFQTSIQGFPQFDNPFSNSQVFTFSFGFNHGGAGYQDIIKTHGTNNSCATATYWKCITDPNGADGNSTFIEMTEDDAGPSEFLSLNTTGWPAAGTVRSGTLTLQCRSNMTDAVPINVALHEYIPITGGSGNSYLVSINENVFCKVGSTFTTTTVHLHVPDAIYNLNGNAHPPNLQMWILGQVSTSFYISTVTFTAIIGDTTGCSGGDFFANVGCQFQEFSTFAMNVGRFIVNGIVFIGQVLVYLLSIIGNFIGLFGYFFSVPGMPSILQSILTVLFIGITLFIILVIMGKVRGTGNTG